MPRTTIWGSEHCEFPDAEGYSAPGERCQECCVALGVQGKDRGVQCKHQNSKGCSLHDTDAQPVECRDLNCGDVVRIFGKSYPHYVFFLTRTIVDMALSRGKISFEVATRTLEATRLKLEE